jgi:predicted alpha-1,6-mannanase (GH76 family)
MTSDRAHPTNGPVTPPDWAGRAELAERAVRGRHSRRVWAVPGTSLGVNSWPASRPHRLFLGWNYWWQAHLLDCLVDAQARDPRPDRLRTIARMIRSVRLLNAGRWTNDYYDDMAWLALALHRADRVCGTDHGAAVRRLTGEILDAWSDAEGGGIPWRRGDVFKNTPANGPAAILLARTGHLDRAAATADWLDERLRDRRSGLIWDGLRPGADGATQFETTIYSYCQGVVLGAELELVQRVSGDGAVHSDRIHALVSTVERHLSTDGVLCGHQGGDSGLFTGILARYLALVALALPSESPAADRTKGTARRLVLSSAEAAWVNAVFVRGLPIFGPDWNRPAVTPTTGGSAPERDLSVQLSGWMLMEAAHAVRSDRPPAGY